MFDYRSNQHQTDSQHTKRYINLLSEAILKLISIICKRLACEKYAKLTVRRDFGGTLAKNFEYPWMAALGYLNLNYNISYDCGGTVISEWFLLSAAHCAKPQRKPVVARLGKVSKYHDIRYSIDFHRMSV